MKEKFDKNSAKKINIKKRVILIFLLIILLIGILLLVVGVNNIIQVEKINDDAKNVTDQVASDSMPIIINNLVLGATYKNTWVSSEKYYFFGNTAKGNKLDVYTENGKKGTYQIENVNKGSKSDIYITTSNINKSDEYLAIYTNEKNIMPQPATKIESVTDEDYKIVKSALGIYRAFNPSLKIKEAYNVYINNANTGTVYVVSNVAGKYFGGYSAVIYKDYTGKSSIIKYSYVSNLKESSKWPVYSFKFVADLNLDDKCEIILQETKETEVKYDVIEFNEKNGKFVEVLSSKFDIK